MICMEKILYISITLSMILYYIYETDVIWEYLNKISNIFPKFTNSIFNQKLLIMAYKPTGDNNYIDFLNSTYNTFFTRLLSCPICLSFWLSVLSGFIFNIANIPYYAILSLTIYYILKILTKASYKI
jgi:hypothetical protein